MHENMYIYACTCVKLPVFILNKQHIVPCVCEWGCVAHIHASICTYVHTCSRAHMRRLKCRWWKNNTNYNLSAVEVASCVHTQNHIQTHIQTISDDVPRHSIQTCLPCIYIRNVHHHTDPTTGTRNKNAFSTIDTHHRIAPGDRRCFRRAASALRCDAHRRKTSK